MFETQTECINPATGEVIGTVPVNTIDDVKTAIRKAHIAQKTWGGLPVGKRVKYVRSIRDYLVAHVDEIAETMSRDNGKPRVDALATEVFPSTMAISYYCKKAKKFLKPKRLFPGNILLANKWSKIIRVPYGVVGIISPWNYPFTIPFSEVIMALLAGNAVILKTASETQLIGKTLEACVMAANLPEGIFSYINMPGSRAGDAFLENGIDKIFFTGSVKVGKTLMSKAGESLTPVVLELGGNDPMLVCEDADLYRAAMGALWAGFSNSGQSCGGVERIYVHEKVYEPFLSILKEKVEALRVGPDTDYNVDMGAMTTLRQMETVTKHVEDAANKGAVIYAKSQSPTSGKGQFLPAMVLTGVNHTMITMKEETFGPIVGVMKVKNMEEAIALANDSDLGLTASVWSKDHAKAEKIAEQIQSGVVTINDHLMSHGMAETPWGGFKNSGIGRTHGSLGFDEMTQPQLLVNDILPLVKKNMWWHPYSKSIYDGLRGAINILYGKGLKDRVAGIGPLLKIVPRYFTKS